MSLGEVVGQYLHTTGLQQQEAAMAWLSEWEKEAGKPPASNTVTSRMSELLADKPKGVRFFFNHDERRIVLLLQILDVPEAEREGVRRLASEALDNGGRRPTRMIIDASAWSDERDDCDRRSRKQQARDQRQLGQVETGNGLRYLGAVANERDIEL